MVEVNAGVQQGVLNGSSECLRVVGNNPNPTGCNVIETIGVQKFQQILGSLQLARKVALDQVAYENEARGVKSLKIPAIRRCNKGTIVDGRVKNPNRTGMNACNRNFREFIAHCSTQERLYQIKQNMGIKLEV